MDSSVSCGFRLAESVRDSGDPETHSKSCQGTSSSHLHEARFHPQEVFLPVLEDMMAGNLMGLKK